MSGRFMQIVYLESASEVFLTECRARKYHDTIHIVAFDINYLRREKDEKKIILEFKKTTGFS